MFNLFSIISFYDNLRQQYFLLLFFIFLVSCPPSISPIIIMFSCSRFSTTMRLASFLSATSSAESQRDLTSGRQEMIVAWQFPPL